MLKPRSRAILVCLIGFVLGLGAPVGGLVLRTAIAGPPWSFSSILNEWKGHHFYYWYMTLTTPLFFAAFGAYLGWLIDRIRNQRRALLELTISLEKRTITDELTGIHNRRHLFREIEREASRSARYNHPIAGIMIDVDNFKSINDLHGHTAGDRVLRDIAAVLTGSIRSIDTVARYGGDEFVILLPESKADAAGVVADRVLQNIREYRLKTERQMIPVTVSVGICFFEKSVGLTPSEFIDAADLSLRKAKTLGKDRISTAG